jgi:hypothetical protein
MDRWPDGCTSTDLAGCSGCPRESIDDQWREEGDDVSCHFNIHMLCHVNQIDTSRSRVIPHQQLSHQPKGLADNRWLGQPIWEVSSTVIEDCRSLMGQWLGIKKIGKELHSSMNIIDD